MVPKLKLARRNEKFKTFILRFMLDKSSTVISCNIAHNDCKNMLSVRSETRNNTGCFDVYISYQIYYSNDAKL